MITGHLKNYYKSTGVREGVLSWYPFRHDVAVLDFSGGALNELLKKRCEIVVTSIIDDKELFDFIVVLDPTNFSIPALKKYRERLKNNGRLLLAYENPFALRYWNGKNSPVTGLSYDSIFGRDGRISQAEMKVRLEQAGFGGQKWYYPMTDHWFAHVIYSEDYLPDEFMGQRFWPYFDCYENIQFDERPLYREIIRGKAFEFMCGAYLVEARVNGNDAPCPIDYAVDNASREQAKRFATAVLNDGTARKIPLHEAGKERIKKLLRNHEELAELGVNILTMRIENDTLVMPRIKAPTLLEYWSDKLTHGIFDFDEMVSQFDMIHENINKAAKSGKCWWEMVPPNCFYIKSDKCLLFFDQEYYWEDTSADMAMVRALSSLIHSAAFSADSRTEDWLNELKKRYHLVKRWDDLLRQSIAATWGEVFGIGTPPLQEATENALKIINDKKKKRDANDLRRKRFSIIPVLLRDKGFSHPVIYGYGARGKDLEYVLKESSFNIAAIVDRDLEEYSDISLVPDNKEADIIIVSNLEYSKIISELKEKTELPIYSLEELIKKENSH